MVLFDNGLRFYESVSFNLEKRYRGKLYRCLEITLTDTNYTNVYNAFTSGVGFSIENAYNDEEGNLIVDSFPKYEYNVCHSIKDNMDGTITVEMYKKTVDESALESAEAENAALLLDSLMGGVANA